MSLRGQIVIVVVSLLVIVFVLDALRRGKINEEYCLCWILVMIATDAIVLCRQFLSAITNLVGALVPISTLTMLSLMFVLCLLIYFTMKISVLTNQVKALIQAAALQKKEFDDLRSQCRASTQNTNTAHPLNPRKGDLGEKAIT